MTYMQAVLIISTISALGTTTTAWYLHRIFHNSCKLELIAGEVQRESNRPPTLERA